MENRSRITVDTLHVRLLEAYSSANLNNISLILINLYRNRQYSVLRKIADIISDIVNIEITDEGKGFSKFLMLYHPDRAENHIANINRFARENNLDGLLGYSHILMLDSIDEIANALDGYEDIDYSPVYEWDFEEEGFTIIDAKQRPEKLKTSKVACNFYDAFRFRIYGDPEAEFPSYYLEDIDEFELSSSYINDLEGVTFCIHALSMDLSDNMISDISLLSDLKRLEELNLSENQIELIDPLSSLPNLKRLYLADNHIKDISSLLDLEKLEYVDLAGNNISEDQVSQLIDSGVDVNI